MHTVYCTVILDTLKWKIITHVTKPSTKVQNTPLLMIFPITYSKQRSLMKVLVSQVKSTDKFFLLDDTHVLNNFQNVNTGLLKYIIWMRGIYRHNVKIPTIVILKILKYKHVHLPKL